MLGLDDDITRTRRSNKVLQTRRRPRVDPLIGPGTIYTRGKASDHMAQKVTVFLDLVEKGKAGDRAIIDYNNREGWKLYTIISNKYAPEIMETVRLFEPKNERQHAIKQIMQQLDIECFGIKYKKNKSSTTKWENINIRKLRI